MLHEGAGQEKAFDGNILSQGIARLFLEEVHEVVRADAELFGQNRYGQLALQVLVDIGQKALYLFVLPSRLDVADVPLLNRLGQIDEKLQNRVSFNTA